MARLRHAGVKVHLTRNSDTAGKFVMRRTRCPLRWLGGLFRGENRLMRLNVGVLIIGSLYWDIGGERDQWRSERLQRDGEWVVKAPIRYGRLSDRRGTFTMVFSQLPEVQFGLAKVVKCRNTVLSLPDLIAEAEWLWAAESKRVLSRSISSGWGCVALLVHPERGIPRELVEGWGRHVGGQYGLDEGRLVNIRGILQIPWPALADGSGLVPLDLLLATSNSPTVPCPEVEAIANGWRQGHDEYFRQNRKNGIQTFQDDAIAELLYGSSKL